MKELYYVMWFNKTKSCIDSFLVRDAESEEDAKAACEPYKWNDTILEVFASPVRFGENERVSELDSVTVDI